MALDYRIGENENRMIVVFDEAADPDEMLFAVDLPANRDASRPMEAAVIGLVNTKNEQDRALAMMSKMYEMLVSLGVEDSTLDRVESYLTHHNIACTPSTDTDDVMDTLGMARG